MASVAFEGVRKSFGPTSVIKGVDLRIDDRELVVFVGPSGCGKTTLLRMLAGLERADEGRILIGERVVDEVAPKDRDIAMVFQNYALYPHMTVLENIAFGLKLRGVHKPRRVAAAAEVAKVLGLEPYLDRRPRELSGGQRQRVAMGRAMVRQPAVFLMDEPLSNLDAKLRNQMRVEVKKLQRRLATTMIYVTHDQVEAMTLADRIAVLNEGEVQQFGTPIELYDRPANRFVAGFLGAPAINLFTVERVDAQSWRFPDGQRLGASELALGAAGADARTLDIGVRAEQIEIAQGEAAAGGGRFAWRSRVGLVEPLGGETLLHVALGDTELTAKVPPHARVREGDVVPLSFDPGRAHVFESRPAGRALRPAAGPPGQAPDAGSARGA